MKLLDENIGKTFSDINHTNVFLGQPQKAKATKAKITKRDYIKLKPTKWEKTFANHTSQKGLISKIHKELI